MAWRKKSSGSNTYYINESRSRGFWYVLFNLILIVLTLGLAAALVMAYLSTRISPTQNWVFSFFGLVAPFLFLGNFILLLVWVIRWKLWFVVPLVTLLFGLGHLKALVQFSAKKEYTESVVGNTTRRADQLTVMTYNVHGFWYRQTGRPGYTNVLDSIAAYAGRMNPDVICFQEYETATRADIKRIDSLFRKWPHREVNYVIGGNDRIGFGSAIFSRLPIVNSNKMIFDGTGNSTMYTDILMMNDTVRIFNNHLQTTQIDDATQQRVEKLGVGNGDTEQFMRSMGARLRANYKRRAMQVDTVAKMVKQSPYAVIVAGDFNDTPVSYTYKKMRGSLVDPFVEVGSGYAHTYNRLFSMLRIDYVFHSPVFEPMNYWSEELPWSDHNPVVVRMRRKLSDK